MLYNTIEDAARAFVGQFDAIPQSVIEKLLKANPDELVEITPISRGDRIYVWSGEHSGESGEIIRVDLEDDSPVYHVRLDDGEETIIPEDEMDCERDGFPDVGDDVVVRRKR